MTRNSVIEILIAGGGLGGVAAALAACEAGARVVLVEPTDWLGGQMTSQGVSALDEHPLIETQPPSRSFAVLRAAIREHYVHAYGAPRVMPGSDAPLNPGNGWVSALCFEPRAGVQAIDALLAPHIAAGRLEVHYGLRPVTATAEAGFVREVVFGRDDDVSDAPEVVLRVAAERVIDATELGDLLPLTGTAYVTGAEAHSDTGEPHAVEIAAPDEIQSFTYCFAIEHRPGESHVIPKPPGYDANRTTQPFSLTIGNPTRTFGMFEPTPSVALTFWTYRRMLDAALLDPSGARGLRDIALINWHGNDYHNAHLIDVSRAERGRIEQDAKNLSLGFLYWLQTECPRDDGSGNGYPGLRLLAEVMGTRDGLSKTAYVREARRIVPLRRVLAQHVLKEGRTSAEHYDDTVGIGWYHMDLHPAVGQPDKTFFLPTHPFQIPLGALIPQKTRNLLAANKNIGVTHLSNGAYRLHPVEWAIGEAAGAAAAYSLRERITLQALWYSSMHLRAYQELLRARGVALDWRT
jgi:hypothetical protein